MNKLLKILGTLFYTGYFPIYPSVVGSLWGIGFLVLIKTQLVHFLLILFFFILGSLSARERIASTENPDPPEIILDEVCGILITFLWVGKKLVYLIGGFLIFQLFDLLKPFPLKRLEKVRGGWGVVLDDVFAGMYANIILRLWILVYSISL